MATDLCEMELTSTNTNGGFSTDRLMPQPTETSARPLAAIGPLKFLTFSLGAKLYGISADLIEEISNPLPVTRLPGSPKGVAGIAPLRDEILAVIDLRGILKEQSLISSNRSKFIIARSDLAELRVAIPVDRVREMIDIASIQSEVNAPSKETLVFGNVIAEGSECHLLDPYKLWSVLWAEPSI